jgi:uncharacterized membrane protein HdeD (DUF308 family)
MHDSNGAMPRMLSANWWPVALRALFAILFGLCALFVPSAAILSLVMVFAIYMLADAICAFIAAARAAIRGGRWEALFWEGLLDLIAGVLVSIFPKITVLGFALLMAIRALIVGGLMMATAVHIERERGRWWLVAGSVASIAFGLLLLIAPLTGALVVAWWIGTYASIFGIALLVFAGRLRAQRMGKLAIAKAV